MHLRFLTVFSLLILISLQAFATFESILLTKDGNKFVYEKVIEAPGVSKKDLYNHVKAWVMENVKTGDNHVELDDPNFETIISTPTLALPDLKMKHATNQKINFKLKLDFKDGKYKITASSFVYYGETIQHQVFIGEPLETLEIKRIVPSPVKKIEGEFDEEFQNFLTSLQKAATTQKADW